MENEKTLIINVNNIGGQLHKVETQERAKNVKKFYKNY